jgi:hypothetical protein
MGSTTKDLPEIHEETRFNINRKVKVVLTPRGLEVLRERIGGLDFSGSSTPVADIVDTTINLRYERDGVYIFQMYEFMAIFGPSLPIIATADQKYQLFEGSNLVLLADII